MPWLTGPALWLIVGLVLTNLATGALWRLAAASADRHHAVAEACEAKHTAFVALSKAVGEVAKEKAKIEETESRRVHDETAKGWSAAVDVVRSDADRLRRSTRAGSGCGSVSRAPASAERTDDPARNDLPATDEIIAACARDALKLVWLQYHERQQQEAAK